MDYAVYNAIKSVQNSLIAYCKFITANDTGDTGGHQAGFHIHKNAWSLLFDTPGTKGKNKDKFVTIKWQGDFETSSRFIYYGVGTRDEYRLTRFGKGFPFLTDNNVGDLLVLAKIEDTFYEAFVLQSDDGIEEFLNSFGLSVNETNRLIEKELAETSEDRLIKCFYQFIKSLEQDFPPTNILALNARNCFIKSYSVSEKQVLSNPDIHLLNWLEAEYQLFKTIESDRYNSRIKTPFKSVEELVEFANSVLNRRKSRAGKSLEHHLSEVFYLFRLNFSNQGVTEENKKPDFLFPGIEYYHSKSFNEKKLVFLASKTTCKDRWRQILNEADKIKEKHLFTLQQGISKNQLSEMYKYGVRLVVPKPYIKSFPSEFREKIYSLENFLSMVKDKIS
jgi:hypothetical protein